MKSNLSVITLLFLTTQLVVAQVPQLLGVASLGGAHGNGSIITINGDGTNYSAVYSMVSADGTFPGGHLVMGSDKLYYGMTFEGGADNGGTIFRIDPATKAFTRLHDIDTVTTTWVNSDLVRVNDSVFYGLIFNGGPDLFGEMFSFNANSRAYKLVYIFDSLAGALPRNMMMASDNMLYGTADGGGIHGQGVLFRYDPATGTYADLHDFDSTANGTGSYAGTGLLVQAGNGKLYGLCGAGGANGSGVIFSFDTAGNTYSVVHDFTGTDGNPGWINGMIKANDGMLYGMTLNGGSQFDGAIFRFNPANSAFQKLHDFDGTNGSNPVSTLMQASNGKLYGMTNLGGTTDGGVVFSFNLTDSIYTNLTSMTGPVGNNPYGGLTEFFPVTGIAEEAALTGIMIYPNPASDHLILHASTPQSNGLCTISIFNVLEETIYTSSGHLERDLLIDRQSWPSGIYFVRVQNETASWTGKFVKE